MTSVTIYHNPRCSKSRQTLALLEARDIEPNIVPYLTQPPTAGELQDIVKLLGIPAFDIVRTNEDEFKSAGIDSSSSDKDVIAAIIKSPKLMQRPIVVANGRAVIGRPPENVLDII